MTSGDGRRCQRARHSITTMMPIERAMRYCHVSDPAASRAVRAPTLQTIPEAAAISDAPTGTTRAD